MPFALAFLSGAAVPVFAATVTHFFTRRRERLRLMEDRRFQIFMKLLELNNQYFFWAGYELRGQAVPAALQQQCRKLAWEIADMLRVGEVDCLEETLEVCVGPGFETASKRHDAMGALLGRLGSKVNPRYQKHIRDISARNIAGAPGQRNAPGRAWP
jgi:hypothetical protein